MRPILTLVALSGLAAGAGCAARVLPVATEADAARVAAEVPGTTVAALNRGRALVLLRCGNCHQPHAPDERVAADWPVEVTDMSVRAGLSPQEAVLVERYLVAFAKDRVVLR